MKETKKATAREIKERLVFFSEEVNRQRALLTDLRSVYRLSVWRPSGMPKARAANFHRIEDGIMLVMQCQERIEKLENDIAEHIDVLRGNSDSIRNAGLKIRMLEMRYQQRRDWDDICAVLFGQQADYPVKKNKYKRRMFRLCDAAFRDIWIYWQR